METKHNNKKYILGLCKNFEKGLKEVKIILKYFYDKNQQNVQVE